jgi:hypothetical protein
MVDTIVAKGDLIYINDEQVEVEIGHGIKGVGGK